MCFTSKESLCCTCFSFLDLRLEEQSGPAGRADKDHQAEVLLHTPPTSLLDVLKEAGGDVVVESEMAEVWQLHQELPSYPRHGIPVFVELPETNRVSHTRVNPVFQSEALGRKG